MKPPWLTVEVKVDVAACVRALAWVIAAFGSLSF
jgi:hypothetical protein